MPELPEVETVKRGLHARIVGRSIKSEVHDTAKGFPNTAADVKAFMIGAKVAAVRRRAKVLIIDLDSGYSLVVHLKMTGQLVYRDGLDDFGAGHPNGSLLGELPDKSTRVDITFDDESHLYFNDQRKFGWMRLMPTVGVPELPFMQKVGPEPLEDDFTPEVFAARISRRPRSAIKAVILDQTVLAGVGNIYADEALWGAKIHPLTTVEKLTKREIKSLYTEICYVLNMSIEKGGSSSRNYVNADGGRGKYLDFARAYKRDRQACARCGTILIKIRAAGRGTHICPHDQVLK